MSKRERIEDLGRLLVNLENMSMNEIFNQYHGRNKDFVEAFGEWNQERKDDFLHNLIYGLSKLDEQISECVVIARGHDDLNCENE